MRLTETTNTTPTWSASPIQLPNPTFGCLVLGSIETLKPSQSKAYGSWHGQAFCLTFDGSLPSLVQHLAALTSTPLVLAQARMNALASGWQVHCKWHAGQAQFCTQAEHSQPSLARASAIAQAFNYQLQQLSRLGA